MDELSGFEGFIIMPQCRFVSRYGVSHFDVSMTALYEMTKRFTAEGDIRVFLQRYPKKTMAVLKKLTRDKSAFARRLASEGTRLRLPLTGRVVYLQKNPVLVVEMLEMLKKDPSEIVRRSVANNLNDMSEDLPGMVVDTLAKWSQDGSSETAKLIRTAMRSLAKEGHPDALKILGFPTAPRIEVRNLTLDRKKVVLGDTLQFRFEITSRERILVPLMIDYVMLFLKANGTSASKVFKAGIKKIRPGESIVIIKNHPIRKINTRKYYPGLHSLEIQINGQRFGGAKFELEL